MSKQNKSIWIGQCISTIIFSAITFLTVLIPYSINNGVSHALDYMPVIGDGTIIDKQVGVVNNLFSIIGVNFNTFSFIFKNNVIIFYSILLLNVLFSLLLILTRVNILRIIFKIISSLFGIALIIISLSYFIIIVCTIYSLFTGYFGPLNNVLNAMLSCGIIYYFITIFFISILSRKQFGWFSERTW